MGVCMSGMKATADRRLLSNPDVRNTLGERQYLVGSCHEREHCEWRLPVIPSQ